MTAPSRRPSQDQVSLSGLMDAVMELQRSVGAMGAQIETIKGDLGMNT